MKSDVEVPGEAVEAVAEILCAWDYRDNSGQTWPTLSDVGRDSFRVQAAQLLEGTMPGRGQSAAALIRSQERQRVRELFEAVDELYGDAIGLIRDLLRDAERIYEPGFEDPPHIAAAKDLGEHEATLKQVQAALDSLEDEDG